MEITERIDKGTPVIAAIDIGGTKIDIGLVRQGVAVIREILPVQADKSSGHALERIATVLNRQLGETQATLQGIGIACTGPVEPRTGELGDVNTLPGWKGWNPVQDLAALFNVTAAMENDADAVVLGEYAWGAGKGKQTVISITVGTGIGSGIVWNGSIYRGARYTHPEIGHHILEIDGASCTCGSKGCWETLASGPALEAWYAARNPKGDLLSGEQICDLARSGYRAAQDAVDHLATGLGIGLANVILTWAPDVIVLSGSVMQSADLLLDRIHEVVRNRCLIVPSHTCEIVLSSLGRDAGLIGAAQVWHNRFGK